MLHEIDFLITLHKPSGERGQIILFRRAGIYEAHWCLISNDHELTDICYSGPDLDKAWQAAEAIQRGKCKEGFTMHSPFITFSLTAIPHSYLYLRKLECFASKHRDQALFHELKKWRRSASSSANIPPYFIGTDKLLSILATFVPQKEEELMQVPGIGKYKLEQYGPAILEITKRFIQPYPFPLEWVQEQISQEELASWLLEEYLLKEEKKQARLRKEKEEKLRLLEAIQDRVSVDEAAERLNIPVSQLIRRIRELAKEGYEVIPYLCQEVERIKEKDVIQDLASTLGSERLKPIFEQMYGNGEDIPVKEKGERYNRIRLVCTYLQLRNVS